ncbi:MAG TPA: poly(R)-hydroxyalkanoic acid synthase subunit PhaE [Bacteroidia bacterium]|nr:poly(R)-hydroxyalkanoic acid synthase subunit PhaE [Bacteroidia bacterium]
MKTTNPVIDTLVESQTQFVNNWMESAKKMQAALSNGNIASEGQSLYKEYFDKQMNVFKNFQQSSTGLFDNQENNPQEFFKNWFNQQAKFAKQMADFNQSINNSFQNFGKPAQDYMANFSQANTAFTNIYNSWISTLNSTYDTMSRHMNSNFGKDVFGNFMQGSQVYTKMMEVFQPMMDAMQKGQFNMENFKNYFNAENLNKLTKQMFSGVYNESSIKEIYDNSIKQLHSFFAEQNNLSKEYYNQMQNISSNFPHIFGNTATTGFRDLYNNLNNVFGKTFEPLLKLVNPSKEKQMVEETIALMDRLAEYTIKQTELHAFLNNTTRTSIEKVAEKYAEKYGKISNMNEVPSTQELFSEWVKVNEQLFSELFASEEFSKVKAEALNLSLDVKKQFENQFEHAFSHYPVVFRSQVEEMQKTVYELKKQVKDLQSKLSTAGIASLELSEEGSAKSRKK